ncbi:site-specific DNA-methyltransferase [Ruminococcus bromii]|nr:site-specific DNA-methyltransferase [Ruminococcus bromii]MTQ94922.1 site-specific DNA-methyltransferase [Ruminococcus bromii]MTR79836.1 site-specific DNA-methyltransferase [Ruminococcus bromii]MTR89082.1 site-specific DNA-methyltransferase [Ruminococcus bromii]
MDKLKMQTANKADENFKKLAEMFPNAVTETIDENGEVVRAIDKDVLMQEINTKVVDGKEERYQFTWPDKKKSVLLANAPINKTLRPCRKESVDFDNTENLYIEGDNLEVLKLLQETYLGKIKMIYIDPPYNTGNDFVYADDFAQSTDEYLENSGQFDDEGNRLVKNLDSNGRFHTDWLNMIYTRIRISKDLLQEDGVIFISIDDNEIDNLSKICSEIFGEDNFICKFIWKSKLGKVGTTSTISATHEYILCYAKNSSCVTFKMIKNETEGRKENLRQWGVADRREDRPSMYYPIKIDGVEVYPIKEDGTDGRWRVGESMAKELLAEGVLELTEKNGKYNIYRNFPSGISYTPYDTLLLDNIGTTAKGATMLKTLELGKIFDFSKPVELIKHFAFLATSENDIVIDFFSGSATTAHAVMQLNAEDGGNRKFIMVQLPEETDKKSEAYKAGYKNICEIGKERIRRAGQKIRNEQLGIKNEGDNSSLQTPNSSLDTGFRVLKCDSSNMKDVYYNPAEYEPSLFASLEDNIKEDRTSEDLLFQVMLDLGILLSSKIQVRSEKVGMRNYSYFDVEDGYLIACFDKNIDEEVITAIAKQKPYYFVMRDSSMANDSVATNFEQIFAAYSPDTVRKVL